MTTRKLAAFVADLKYADLPQATIEMSKRLMLDGLGCMLAGVGADHARNVANMVRELGGSRQATILPGTARGSVRDAAFVNGIALYSIGLNDVHVAAEAHPGACVIPAALAIAEWKCLPGTELIAAMVAGYELVGRVGRAILPSHRQRGFHATGTCGTFGATAAAARLLGFNSDKTANAFGIAGSQAAGLYECHHDGSSTMIFHAGRAAQNGVEAALLVAAGMTGPVTVLEGSKGFFRAVSDEPLDAAVLAGLGQCYELDATSFRPYFGCSSTISASAATANLIRRAGLRADEIDEITAYCHPIVARDNADTKPVTLLAARLSLPFNVALVLHYGDVLTADLPEADLHDADMRALLPKVKLVADRGMGRRAIQLTVRRKDGSSESEAIMEPRGSAENPLTWEDVVRKFRCLTGALIAESDQSAVIDAVSKIESLNGVQLAAVLNAAAAGEGWHGPRAGTAQVKLHSGRIDHA